MKLDELIEYLEKNISADYVFSNDRLDKAIRIALAALKAHKAGYQMYTYDYSEKDWLPAECELNYILKEFE